MVIIESKYFGYPKNAVYLGQSLIRAAEINQNMNTQNVIKLTFAALILGGLALFGLTRHLENFFPVAVSYGVVAALMGMAALDIATEAKRRS